MSSSYCCMWIKQVKLRWQRVKRKLKKLLKRLPIENLDRFTWIVKHPDRTVRFGIYLSAFGLLLLIGVLATFYSQNRAKAWFDSNWDYRMPISVTNSSGGDLSNFQISFTLDTASLIIDEKMQVGCDDIRVTNADGDLLDHWVEESGNYTCNDTDTKVWAKVPTIPSAGTTLYVYYSNPDASNVESGDDVFEFFDDFADASIDGAKWTQGTTNSTSGTNFSESGGYLSGGNQNRYIQSVSTFTGDYAAAARVQTVTDNTNGFMTIGFWGTTKNSFGILDHNNISYYRNDGGWTSFTLDGTGQWQHNEVKVVGTNATYWRIGETSGSATNSTTNSGLSSEYIRLGSRYDNGNYDQNYVVNWDWVMVRKVITTDPVATLSDEEMGPGLTVVCDSSSDSEMSAYWRLDDSPNTECSSESNNGVFYGATKKNEDVCLSGKCLAFDGNADYITFPDDSSLRFGSDDFSIGAWIKIGAPGPIIFMSKRNNDGDEDWYFGSENNQKFIFYSAGSTTQTAQSDTITFRDNRWHHIAVVRESGSLTFYLDGNAVGTTASVDGNFNNTNDLLIGKDVASGTHLIGLMDEIKIYGYARTAAEIKTDAIQMAGSSGASVTFGRDLAPFANQGIVGYWRMDESAWAGTAGEVLDTSNMNNHGTRQGDATTTVGKFGNAGIFDGTGDYVALGQNSGLNPAENLTLATWVKPTGVVSEQTLIGRWDESGDKRSYRLFINSSAKLCAEITSDGTSGTVYQECTTASVTAGSYTHVGATVEPTGAASYLDIKLYIGGVLQTTTTSGSQITVIFGG